jgi:hypothetical protein
MANVDYNTKLKSVPFGSYLTTGDLSKSLSSVLPASAEQPQNFMDTALQAFGKYKITPDQSTLSNLILSQALLGPKPPGFSEKDGLKEQLDYASQKKRDEADYAQKLGKESTAEAFKYKMFQQGLDKLGNAFNPYGSKEGALAYAAHLSSIPGNVSEQMRSMNIQPPAAMSYNAPQRQYFT